MKILVDNVIKIIGAEPEIEHYCKTNLEIENPQFVQNERLGFPTYNIPRRLYWYEKRAGNFILPFGCLRDVFELFPEKELYVLNYNKPCPIMYKSNIKLFDYQVLALIEDRALLVVIYVIGFLAEGEVFELEPFPDALDFRAYRKGISLGINTAKTPYHKVDKG